MADCKGISPTFQCNATGLSKLIQTNITQQRQLFSCLLSWNIINGLSALLIPRKSGSANKLHKSAKIQHIWKQSHPLEFNQPTTNAYSLGNNMTLSFTEAPLTKKLAGPTGATGRLPSSISSSSLFKVGKNLQ